MADGKTCSACGGRVNDTSAEGLCPRCLIGLATEGAEDETAPASWGGSDWEGREIGKHLVLEEIGRGGMGVVYRAYHRELRCCVALHAIDTALVSLAHRGAAEPNLEARQWRRTGALPPDAHPWEQWVHESIPEKSETSIEKLRERLEASLDRLRQDLENQGLLMDCRSSFRARFLPSLLGWSIPILIGFRMLQGIEQHEPVGGLLVLGLVTLGSALAFSIKPHHSRRGKARLSLWRQHHARPSAGAFSNAAAMPPSAVALAVGLHGLGVLAGTRLDTTRQALQQDRSAGGCGGGCGGGAGGCGGGCGGCGGCGG